MEDFGDIGVEGYCIVVSMVSVDTREEEDLSRTVLSLGDALSGGVTWVSIHRGHLLSVERKRQSTVCNQDQRRLVLEKRVQLAAARHSCPGRDEKLLKLSLSRFVPISPSEILLPKISDID